MAILDAELSPGVAAGFTGGPEFNTRIVQKRNKRERRNANWSEARHHWTAPFNNISSVQFREIKGLFNVCRAQLYGFFFKDPADHTATLQSLGNAPSGSTAVQLQIVSTADGVSYTRTNFQAYPGLTVYQNGVAKAGTYDDTTNTFTPTTAWTEGQALTWSGTFRVPVRFTTDWLPFSIDNRRGDDFAMNGSVEICEISLDELTE
jgi:uncharacterized protein (TIGR02217 family)